MSEAITTQVLIEQFQQGDDRALNELFKRYQMRVLTAVRIRLGAKLRRKVESCDIVQDVMMDALRKLESFDFKTEGAFLHYINRVVTNKIRDEADHWKYQKRDMDRELPLEKRRSPSSSIPLPLAEDPGVPTPSKIIGLQEDLALLEQAMDRLGEENEEYRDLIVAVKIEGRTYGEIAEETGVSPDAVRMKVNRAMAVLARGFQDMRAWGAGEEENGSLKQES